MILRKYRVYASCAFYDAFSCPCDGGGALLPSPLPALFLEDRLLLLDISDTPLLVEAHTLVLGTLLQVLDSLQEEVHIQVEVVRSLLELVDRHLAEELGILEEEVRSHLGVVLGMHLEVGLDIRPEEVHNHLEVELDKHLEVVGLWEGKLQEDMHLQEEEDKRLRVEGRLHQEVGREVVPFLL